MPPKITKPQPNEELSLAMERLIDEVNAVVEWMNDALITLQEYRALCEVEHSR